MFLSIVRRMACVGCGQDELDFEVEHGLKQVVRAHAMS